MSDNDPQLTRIYDELESIRAQLRSMAESIASNNGDLGQRVTAVEAWREGFEKYIATLVAQREERNKLIDAELKKIPELEKLVERIKGISIAVGIGFSVVVSGLELFRQFGGK